MNEVFISNFRKIIEQNLNIFKNSMSDSSAATGGKSVEQIIAMTQKQLILLRPTVLLSRCEHLQSEGPDSSIHSTHSEFNGFPDYDDSKLIEVEVELCNQGNITSNIEEIKNIIETEDHEIPFIDIHSQTVEKLILLSKEKEKEGEKQIEKPKSRRGRKRKESINTEKQTIRKMIKETPLTLHSSEEVLTYSFSPLGNLESEILPQSRSIANKNVGDEEKKEIKKSLRTRKPVMSAGYYEAVEPSPKRKKKSKSFSSTNTFENAPKDFLKIDTLPQNAPASEVQINFPLSLPLKDGKYRICIDLDKINLPPGTFRAITKTPQKRPTRSTTKENSNESVPAEKSDLVKYLEIFSSDCANQNFDGSSCESPVNNNNNSMIATDNFQDQSSEPQIGDIVILQPNQSSDQASRVGNVISMNSEGVIIDESARFLISNQLDKDAGIAPPPPGDTGPNTSNASVGLHTSSASAGPVSSIDGAQMEDFEFPIDIDYRLYEYIENGEIFNQANTNPQPSQRENVVRSTSSNSISNTQTKPTIQQSNLDVKNTRKDLHKRQSTAQVDTMPACSVKSSTLPELCENRNPAHSQKSAPRDRYTIISENVLDLSVEKPKGSNVPQNDSVMDLTVSSSFHESSYKEKEKVTTSYKHLTDLSRDVPQTLNSEPIQRISLEEYQRRNVNAEKTDSKSVEENTEEKNKGPKLCDKNCVACEENRILNNPLDYEFDEHSSNFELPSLAANKAGPTYNNYADQSPATKDSGIDSEDCGNKSTGKDSNVSLRGDSTPIYRTREDEGLKSCHEIDDDALSIFINSAAGSPFYFSENNDDDDGCNSIVEKTVDGLTTPPPPKISCDVEEEAPAQNVAADNLLRVVADRSSGSKKVFKIPKLMNSTLRTANAVHSTSILNDLETNFRFPECSTSQDTNADVCIKPLFDSNFTFTGQALMQSVEKNAYGRKDVIGDIFGNRPCFMYLAGSCQKPNCKFSHEIIDCNILRKRLSNVSNTTLQSGYSFISRNRNLFRLYFSAFCDTFSQRGDRKRLVGMIRECQQYQETAPFLKLIVQGFMKTGLSQVDATKVIIENFISSTTEAMDILVDLILDSDVTQFISTLESYVTNPRYKFKMEAIDKLAFKCNRTKHFDVIQLLLKIILFQLPKQEVRNFQSAELVKFLDMVRNSHMTKTVENVYDSCMNNNKKHDTKLDEVFSAAISTSSNRTTLPSMPSLTPLPSSLTSSLLNNFTKRL